MRTEKHPHSDSSTGEPGDAQLSPSALLAPRGLSRCGRDPLFAGALLAGPPVAWLWLTLAGATAPPLAGTVAVLLFLVIYPLLEELVFRGLLQGRLLETAAGGRRLGPLSVANLLTALLFALAHWPRGGALLAAGVVLPALVFGFFRERHQSLYGPMLLHGWYNASVLLVAL